MKYEDVPLVNNKEHHNYEMIVEGHRSFIDYRLNNNIIYLIHTEVPPELEGGGLAAVMVAKAFEDIEKQGLKMVPLCAYVQFFLKRHPEWKRILVKG